MDVKTLFSIWGVPNLLFGRTSFSGMLKVVLSEPPFRDQPYGGHIVDFRLVFAMCFECIAKPQRETQKYLFKVRVRIWGFSLVFTISFERCTQHRL